MPGPASLRLGVKILQQPIYLDEPCPVRVTLSNAGVAPLLVNGRLAVGYRDNLARELYAEVVDLSTDLPARVYEADYDRPFSPPSDYVWLPPGESVGASFDLWEWYAPTKAGSYRLVIYYQADEPLAEAPPQVVQGIYPSNPVTLTILDSP